MDGILKCKNYFHGNHLDLFAESDKYLISRFRLPRLVLTELCDTLEPVLRSHTRRLNPVPPHVQIICTLGFLATGTFQRELADWVGISQPSISRALPRVVDGIHQLATQYISFPYRPQQQLPVKRGFYTIAGLPNIIGAIGCTRVRIKAPSPDPFPYLNSKQFHKINVQLICNAQYHLLNVVSCFPGGAHDSYILQNSSVGDRGYALAPWLMMPLVDPQTPHETSYNQSHPRTRSTIKRTIRILKGRWMCLGIAGGELLHTPEKVCRIIMACCVLHNMAMNRAVPLPPQPPLQDVYLDPLQGPENRIAVQVRQQIISHL
uniref:Putative nuclease HARBI1 n=1 Tax=Paramormyrops kingsleyae TaxID=1676925 RepID=A0A3B3SEG3_9TELE